jgi:hypothetical protein
MKSPILMLCAAAALPLAGCASTYDNPTMAGVGTGAAIGAAGGAGVAALAGGDLLAGALIGGAVGGIAGAVWADRDRDGRVDGYVREGQYYEGAPPNYNYQSASAPPQCRSVAGTAATGAAIGAAGGAVVGALAGGPLAGALVGAAVGGLGGAVWADANNDGCVDGYVREGQYYEGAPPSYSDPAPSYQQPVGYRSGERG